nr:MAG TPA_asm: hypothetical protein [Caudoviricetes sp.]
MKRRCIITVFDAPKTTKNVPLPVHYEYFGIKNLFFHTSDGGV